MNAIVMEANYVDGRLYNCWIINDLKQWQSGLGQCLQQNRVRLGVAKRAFRREI
jgi:hypothetical protein